LQIHHGDLMGTGQDSEVGHPSIYVKKSAGGVIITRANTAVLGDGMSFVCVC